MKTVTSTAQVNVSTLDSRKKNFPLLDSFYLGTIQVLRHHVSLFLTFLGPPTHLFDDLQYCKSSKIQAMTEAAFFTIGRSRTIGYGKIGLWPITEAEC